MQSHLEFNKLFASRCFSLLDFQHVVSNSFTQRTALSNRDGITILHADKTWGQVSSNITMTLFITVVFWNVVQVITTNDDGSAHFGADHDTYNTVKCEI